jgi:hypothetical protein
VLLDLVPRIAGVHRPASWICVATRFPFAIASKRQMGAQCWANHSRTSLRRPISFVVRPNTRQTWEVAVTDHEVINAIDSQRILMVAVATGGPRIETVNREYMDRRAELGAELKRRGWQDPNPYQDLWDWYGKWSSGDLPTYWSRRMYLSELYGPLLELVQRGPALEGSQLFGEATGWARVDRALGDMRQQLEQAHSEEQCQAVGLVCREILISVAHAVYDPNRYPTLDGVPASDTDAKRMLEAFLHVELAGGANETSRRYSRSAFDLANELQHRRTASCREAAMCAQAAAAVVNLIAIVSGRRDPETANGG